jgi:hypothetical protein
MRLPSTNSLWQTQESQSGLFNCKISATHHDLGDEFLYAVHNLCPRIIQQVLHRGLIAPIDHSTTSGEKLVPLKSVRTSPCPRPNHVRACWMHWVNAKGYKCADQWFKRWSGVSWATELVAIRILQNLANSDGALHRIISSTSCEGDFSR